MEYIAFVLTQKYTQRIHFKPSVTFSVQLTHTFKCFSKYTETLLFYHSPAVLLEFMLLYIHFLTVLNVILLPGHFWLLFQDLVLVPTLNGDEPGKHNSSECDGCVPRNTYVCVNRQPRHWVFVLTHLCKSIFSLSLPCGCSNHTMISHLVCACSCVCVLALSEQPGWTRNIHLVTTFGC